MRTVARFIVLIVAVCIGGHILEHAHPSWVRQQPGISALFAQELAGQGRGQGEAGENAAQKGMKSVAYCFEVPLPITDTRVLRQMKQELRKLPKTDRAAVFIFEFNPSRGTAGEGSAFGAAIELANELSGEALSSIKTVAWVRGTVKGHAVLPILACQQIVMAKEAAIGAAGINEKTIDKVRRAAYQDIAERRLTVKPPVALGMLDKDLAVYRVITLEEQGRGGGRFVTEAELQKLQADGLVSRADKVFQEGDHHLLTADAMREYGFASHLADDRPGLALALGLPLAALRQSSMPEGGWKPVRVDLSGPVHQQAVNWIVKSIDEHQRRGDFNLLVLYINSGGGDLEQSRRLAAQVAGLEKRIDTVAFVDRQARGDAALVALACEELVMHPDAVLGGPGESSPRRVELDAVRAALPEIFEPLGRDWSLPLAMIDPAVEIHRYRHVVDDAARYLTEVEHAGLPDFDQWEIGQPVETHQGLTGTRAESMGAAQGTARNFDEFRALYQLEGELAMVRPNWALAFIEWLSDPRIAGMLLFVGWFALMFEMSTPGLGLPGFLAVLCFLLYFWSQFLHGTAGWLEVLLFSGGILCLLVEVFVLPGFGVFGAGGALMVIVSIVLASQTFVVPMNAYQLRQFPISLLMVAAGMAGGIASIYVLHRFLPGTPYFNRMLLSPPEPEEREALSRREALVTWEHLLHKRGVASTPLVPAGKVLFGDELVDCVSNGELIAKGTPVVVEQVAGNHVVVRKVNP